MHRSRIGIVLIDHAARHDAALAAGRVSGRDPEAQGRTSHTARPPPSAASTWGSATRRGDARANPPSTSGATTRSRRDRSADRARCHGRRSGGTETSRSCRTPGGRRGLLWFRCRQGERFEREATTWGDLGRARTVPRFDSESPHGPCWLPLHRTVLGLTPLHRTVLGLTRICARSLGLGSAPAERL